MKLLSGKQAQNAIEAISELFSNIGEPDDIAAEIDDIIFDWIGSSEQDFQDWHKNKLHTLKTLRDMFTTIHRANAPKTTEE